MQFSGSLAPYIPWIAIFGGMALIAGAMFIGFSMMARTHREHLKRIQNEDLKLQRREKIVLASSMAGELTENKIKCEAFITIYTELLRNLRETDRRALYEETGDFIHQHPPLSRAVFEGNIEHLSLLGSKLAGDVAQVYAAIRSEPQYFTMDAAMPRASAVRIVEMVLDDAQKTLEPIEPIIGALNIIIRDGDKAENNKRFDD